jgi:hypothetical protein
MFLKIKVGSNDKNITLQHADQTCKLFVRSENISHEWWPPARCLRIHGNRKDIRLSWAKFIKQFVFLIFKSIHKTIINIESPFLSMRFDFHSLRVRDICIYEHLQDLEKNFELEWLNLRWPQPLIFVWFFDDTKYFTFLQYLVIINHLNIRLTLKYSIYVHDQLFRRKLYRKE